MSQNLHLVNNDVILYFYYLLIRYLKLGIQTNYKYLLTILSQ